MNTNITYRIATIADIPTIINTCMAFQAELGETPSPEAVAELTISLETYLRGAIPTQQYIYCLAMDGETMAAGGGMVIRQQTGNFKNPSGKMGYVMSMYTAPSYRRQGMGSMVLNKLMDTGRELGVKLFEMHATPDGAPVYEKQGFVIYKEPTYRKYVE